MTAAKAHRLCSALLTATLTLALAGPASEANAAAPSPGFLIAKAPTAAKGTNKKLAQKKRKKKATKKKRRRGVRKKILSSEAGTKKGQSTKIDFDEASIDGRRRAPMGVAINKNKGNDEYDLIKLRLKWHQEMVDSAANLETGKNR